MVRRFFLFAAQNRAKISLRAEYTETESVYVLYRTKNGSNYIYIIVGNKKSVYVYTETKLVYVYTKQKNGSNYIYIIVGNKK